MTGERGEVPAELIIVDEKHHRAVVYEGARLPLNTGTATFLGLALVGVGVFVLLPVLMDMLQPVRFSLSAGSSGLDSVRTVMLVAMAVLAMALVAVLFGAYRLRTQGRLLYGTVTNLKRRKFRDSDRRRQRLTTAQITLPLPEGGEVVLTERTSAPMYGRLREGKPVAVYYLDRNNYRVL